MRFPHVLACLVACAAAFSVSCGGKVIFEGGSGGTHGSTSVTSGTSSTKASTNVATVGVTVSASSGGQCQMLKAALDKAVIAARECGPQLQVIQCSGSVVMNDDCGCPSIILNETQPAKVMDAKAAYAAWTKAGCGPFACGQNCMPAKGGACEPSTTGPIGTCVGVSPAG